MATSNEGVIMLKAAVVALTLAAQPVIAGQQPSVKPYKNLFKPSTPLPPVAAQGVAGDPMKSKVVCGMTVIPTSPAIDPKMRVMPKSDGMRYTIRAIDPPVCAIAPPAPPTR